VKRQLTRQEFFRVAGGTAAGTALFGIAGCGSAGRGEGVLTWWDYWTTGATNTIIEDALARYMEENPGVKIERRTIPFAQLKPTLLRAAAARKLPDIAIIDNPDHASFSNLGALRSVSDQVDEWGKAEVYYEGPWRSCQFRGHSYGIPNTSNCLALFYNEDMLESAGVDPPDTWDELKEAAAKLTTGNRFGLAVSAINTEEGTFHFLPFVWQAGADIDSLDGEGGRAALQLWVDMVREGSMSRSVLSWTQEDVKNEWVNRRVAMMVNGPWQVPVIEADYPDLNWGVVKLPKGEERATILGGENMAITTACENVEAAWKLLTWQQQPDNLIPYLKETDRQPSRRDLADVPAWADDPVLSVFVEQLEVARPRAYGPNYPEISTYIQEAFQAAISGVSGVEAALSSAQIKVNPLLPERIQQ
jgi:multiple sugar transport system substrate-binding protein